MVNATERVTNNNWCLMERDNGAVIVLYLPLGGSADIDLTGLSENGSSFSIHWYDPRLGGEMQNGSTASIAAGSSGSIGDAPFSLDQDWAVMLKCTDCQTEQPTPDPVPTSTPIAQTSLAPIFQTTPAPVGQTTPSPVSQTTPAPFVQSTPAPFSQETLAPAAAQETPAPFALQTTPAPAQSKSAPAASPMTTGTPAVPVLQTTNVPAAGDTPPSLFVAATTQASPMPTRSAAGGLSSSLLTACLAFSVLLC